METGRLAEGAAAESPTLREARRLAEAAPVNSALVSDGVYRLAKSAFTFRESTWDVILAVRTYLLSGPRDRPAGRFLEHPFVGREGPLGRLGAAWQSVLSGAGPLVLPPSLAAEPFQSGAATLRRLPAPQRSSPGTCPDPRVSAY